MAYLVVVVVDRSVDCFVAGIISTVGRILDYTIGASYHPSIHHLY